MARKNSITHYNDALRELQSSDRKPVYCFCSKEAFFLDRLQHAVEALMPAEHKDFNFDLIYAREKTPEQVLHIARSFPMIAEQRIVIVHDFLSLNVDSYNKTGAGGGLDDFLPYFKKPNPSTLLVLFDSGKPNGNTKLGRTLKKSEDVGYYVFEEVKDYLLPDWVISWARSHHHKEIKPDAAQILAQLAGNNLQVLSTEIDKVCTFVDTSETIRKADIKKIIGSYREYSVFELKDALFAKNMDQSLFIAEQMLHHSKANTGEIIRTVGFFYNVFSKSWQIRHLSAQGKSQQDVQRIMGIHNNWYFNNLWKDASVFRLDEMSRIFEALLDADRAAKGFSKMDPASIFLLMIKRIIN